MATSTTLSPADLFARLDFAEITAEFAKIAGEDDTLRAAEAEIRALVGEALDQGFILDAFNCEVGDEVQNLHGDTGVVTRTILGIHNQVWVRWDAPSPHRGRFTTAHLLTGELRHRR